MVELVGRKDTVERLSELLSSGTGAVVFISGDEGSGKTALASWCLARSERPYLRSRGRERSAQPFSLLRGALPDLEVLSDPQLTARKAEGALRGKALLLEDLQWADEATLEILPWLAER